MRSLIQATYAIWLLAAFGCGSQDASAARPIKPGMTRSQVEKHYEMEIGTRGRGQYVHRRDRTIRYTVCFKDQKSWPWQNKWLFSRDTVISARQITPEEWKKIKGEQSTAADAASDTAE